MHWGHPVLRDALQRLQLAKATVMLRVGLGLGLGLQLCFGLGSSASARTMASARDICSGGMQGYHRLPKLVGIFHQHPH